jgi:hypothetical protein
MTNFDSNLIAMLEYSIQKHGADKPVTLSHLLNIVKMAQKMSISQAEEYDRQLDQAYNETMADAYRYGKD